MEASEVLLCDTVPPLVTDANGVASGTAHPMFMEMIEPGTAYVFSAVGRRGACGAFVDNGAIVVQGGQPNDKITVTLAGKRRGMTGRFVKFSAEAAERNNAFWNQAWK